MTATLPSTPAHQMMTTVINASDKWRKNAGKMTYEDLNLILNAAYHVLEAIPTVTADADMERRIREATLLVDHLTFTTGMLVEDQGEGDKIAGIA